MASSEKDEDTQGCDDPELASQIIKILNHTSESLDEIELARFLNNANRLGEEKLDGDEVKRLVTECTELMLFKEGMTVHLTKQTLRSLIAISQDYGLWTDVWKKISRLAGPLVFSILADRGEIDPTALAKYMDLLQHGTENVRHIRLMVVGMFGVGKTTIIRRLCNQDVSDVKSTVGIDVSVNACEIDDAKQWIVRDLKANPDKSFKQKVSMGYRKRKRAKREKNSIEQKLPSKQSTKIYTRTSHVEHTRADPEPVEPYKQLEIQGSHETEEVSHKLPMSQPIQAQSFTNIREKQNPHLKDFFVGVSEAVNDKNEFEYEERMTTVSIWDFAGQSIYYSTHHFFLSARAIYLLVLDISRDLNDKVPEEEMHCANPHRATSMPKGFTCLDAFKFWMNSIYTYTTPRKDQALKEYKPTIVLVGTFKDKVKKLEKIFKEEDLEKYKEEYFDDALYSFAGSEVIELVYEKKYFVSRDDPDEIFNTLKSDLTSIAKDQPFWDELVPLSYIPLERSVEFKKDESKEAIMKLQELVDIDKTTEYPVDDVKMIKFFLSFQHALGNVLYYDAKLLDNNIILDPQWILDVFKVFISHVKVKCPKHLKEWKDFENNAILRKKLIDELIDQNENASFKEYKESIIQYMEHLDVIAQPIIFGEMSEGNSSSEDEYDEDVMNAKMSPQEGLYIVPCLLSQLPPEEELMGKIPATAKFTPILCLYFKNNFLPVFVCHRLLATCIREWELSVFKDKQKALFVGFGRFNLDLSRTTKLDLWWKDQVLYMKIFRCSAKGYPVNKTMCVKVRKKIQRMIREIFSIHKNFTGNAPEGGSVQYDEHIQCPRCETIDPDHSLLSVKVLKNVEEMNCYKDHTVSQDKALSCWFYEENQKIKADLIFHLRGDMLKYLKAIPAEQEVKERQCTELAEHIGKEYIALGIELWISFKEITHIEMESGNRQTRIKEILIKWTKNCPKPTIAVFKSAFMKIYGLHFKNKEERVKGIVKWYEKIENPTDFPSERELIEVIHLVGERYGKLAKNLFGENRYAKIEQIEMDYLLDYHRTLVILLMWKDESENVTFTFLKDCLVKTFKIDWKSTKCRIAEDEKEEARRADEKKYTEGMLQSRHREVQCHTYGEGTNTTDSSEGDNE